MKRNLCCTLFFICFTAQGIIGQVAKTQVIMINAKTSPNGIELVWPSRALNGGYQLFKRNNLDVVDWGTAIANLPSSATSYLDTSVTPGKSAEYMLVAVNNGSTIALGYIWTGNKKAEILFKGTVMLMIDSSLADSLKTEIAVLTKDLQMEGWKTYAMLADRNATALEVKSKLLSNIASNNLKLTTLFIIGNVPVPYSGDFSAESGYPPPDGHVEGSGDHTGAWAADAYYGDLDYNWTDDFVNRTSGNRVENKNTVGDGKFDHSRFPTPLELEVGRVDLSKMPAFGKSEVALLKDYFKRNHEWRTGQRSVKNRAVVDNNFLSLNLASTAYHNFSTFFPFDSITDGDYITAQAAGSYLWSYGCGAGSYSSCSGIGNTNSFVDNPLDNIFTILAGSFFGDWDVSNNFLRAPLCNSSLASFWGGIPKWYVHTMALGKHIGYGTKETQNNIGFYFNGAFNGSQNSVHIALMGDPTICNSHLPQIKNVSAFSANNAVKLSWNKAIGNFDGYAIYRIDTNKNTYFRVNETPVTDTFYDDVTNWYSGNYTYQVRAIKLETTASGSYYLVGGGENTNVNHTNTVHSENIPLSNIYPNPSDNGLFTIRYKDLVSVTIYDIAGKVLKTVYNPQTIDLSKMPKGIYMVHMHQKDGNTTIEKIIRN